jgi:hypothetical protein
LDELISRFQVLFGTLEQIGVSEQSAGIQYARSLQVSNHDRLVMVEIQDNVLDDLAAHKRTIADLDTMLQVLKPEVAGSTASYMSHTGLRFSLELIDVDPGLSAFLARQQNEAPVLDLSGLVGQGITGDLEVTQEASYQSTMGFYRVLDNQGTVLDTRKDAVTGYTLRPGESGYLEAATNASNLIGILGDLQSSSAKQLTVFENGRLAPYAYVDYPQSARLTYCGFAASNPDGLQHFQMLGDNVFGFEDLFGGGDRDFDDKVVSFRPSALAAAPLI